MAESSDHTFYSLAKTAAAYYHIENPGYLELSGKDQVAFLQRQSTNNLDQLTEDTVMQSVLTSATGRILDVLTIFQAPNSECQPCIKVVTLPYRGMQTVKYLKSRIFFMDQVQVLDQSQAYDQWIIDGPHSYEAIEKVFAVSLSNSFQHAERVFLDTPVKILSSQGYSKRAIILIAPTHLRSPLERALDSAGIVGLSHEIFDLLRIEAGFPGESGELIEDYTPLEINLQHLVSENKGCYTGQEVLARQITYDKITRQMVGLKTDKSVPPGATVAFNGVAAGKVTSATVSPAYGPIALAVLRRPAFEPGSKLTIEFTQNESSGIATKLPF